MVQQSSPAKVGSMVQQSSPAKVCMEGIGGSSEPPALSCSAWLWLVGGLQEMTARGQMTKSTCCFEWLMTFLAWT